MVTLSDQFMQTKDWILVALAVVTLAGIAALWLRKPPTANTRGNRLGKDDLPEEWPLIQRPIFSLEERALYRQLRAALPHHTILAKLPLVRFCQPADKEALRYWFNLLGPIHVSFVICTDNGQVLAALDIEKPTRPTPKRIARIKASVLEACRIRYIVCRSDQLPSAAELQLLVPGMSEALHPGVPPTLRDRAVGPRTTLAHATRGRTAGAPRESQWYDSGFSQDSFFAPEAQRDNPASSSMGAGSSASGLKVVSDRPAASSPARRHGPDDFGPPGDTAGHIVGR